jgi:hypothetical protein
MKIFIHIGFPRSASTYMQKNYFSNNKEINYIGRKLNYGNEDCNFFNALKKIIGYSDNEFLNNKKKILLQLKKIKFSKKKINLISEEGILCQNYWNNNDVYRTLTRLISLFNDLKINIKFIIVVRNQLECIESVYQYFYSSYFKKNFYNLNNFLDTKKIKSQKILYSFNYLKLFKFFKKKNKKVLFLLFEDLKNNEHKIEIKLKHFFGLEHKFKVASRKIVNSNKNFLFKYNITYKKINEEIRNIFEFKKYFKLYKIFLRMKDDLTVLRNFKLTNFQKKRIHNIYVIQNKKLSKYVKLNEKYLKYEKN